MRDILKQLHKDIWLKILTTSSIILIFIGVFCPPIGIVDNSIIISIGELAGFGALWQISKAIDKGYISRIKFKDVEAEFEGENNENKENL